MSHLASYTMSLQSPPPSNPGPADVISFFCSHHEFKIRRFVSAVLIYNCGAIAGIRANRIAVGSSVNEALSFIRDEIPECGSRMSRLATLDPRKVGCSCRRYDVDRDCLFIRAVPWHSQGGLSSSHRSHHVLSTLTACDIFIDSTAVRNMGTYKAKHCHLPTDANPLGL